MAERQKRRIRVVVSDEDLESVRGHGYKFNGILPGGIEDTEGQLFRVVPKAPGEADDTEGQGGRYTKVGQTEEDVEGQAFRIKLEPIDPADAEGHGGRFGSLVPEGTGDAGPWRFEPDDDTEGQAFRYNG